MSDFDKTIRLVTIAQIRLLAEGTRNLGTAAVQCRLHEEFARGNINADQLRRLQSEWNGVQDHLDLFISELAAIRCELEHDINPDLYPDPDGDRDYPGPTVCDSCNNDLELNADLRCTRCGAHA